MAVGVDEAWREDQAVCIEDRFATDRFEIADLYDATGFGIETHIALERFIAGAIVDDGVGNQLRAYLFGNVTAAAAQQKSEYSTREHVLCSD